MPGKHLSFCDILFEAGKIHERDIVFNQCLWRLISIGKSKYLEFFFPSIVEEYIVDCI
jgi:hypothetical protein